MSRSDKESRLLEAVGGPAVSLEHDDNSVTDNRHSFICTTLVYNPKDTLNIRNVNLEKVY